MLLLPVTAMGQSQGLDSAAVKTLDARLDEYFRALEGAPVEVKMEECDFLVNTLDDSLLRQHVALYIYDHYLQSQLMGDEAVAVHMVDDWFDTEKVKMNSDLDLMNARIFAMFNRNSLIGKKAPVLEVSDFEGNGLTLPVSGRLSVLMFYDVTCATCLYETMKLKQSLENADYPIDIYPFYVGSDKTAWKTYIESRWSYETGAAVHHVWDPELDSNFQMEYGVLQTPQMLLIDTEGVIVGRKLNAEALFELLEHYIPKPYSYGGSGTLSFFEALCRDSSVEEILAAADYLQKQALEKGDKALCKHLLGDFMYYLMDTPGEETKAALLSFIDLYVEGNGELFDAPEDEAQILAPARIAKDLLSRVPVGSRIPKMKVNGILKGDAQKGRMLSELPVKPYRLRRLHSDQTYLVLHTDGCGACEDVSRVADSMLSNKSGVQFLFVEPTPEMLDIFDLSVLPHIIQIDRKGLVERKYINIR